MLAMKIQSGSYTGALGVEQRVGVPGRRVQNGIGRGIHVFITDRDRVPLHRQG